MPVNHYSVYLVDSLTDDDADKASDLFVELMKDNIGVSALAPSPALMKLMACAMLRAAALDGEIYVALESHSKELVGFAMWMPPGKDLFSTAEQRNAGFMDFMGQLPAQTVDYYQSVYLEQFPDFVDQTLGPRGKTDAWWLHMAMVWQEHQGMGVCKALINVIRPKAEAKGERLALTTTSDENVSMLFTIRTFPTKSSQPMFRDNQIPKYVKLGFTRRGTKMIPSSLGEWPIHVFEMLT